MSLEEWIRDNSRNLFIVGAMYVSAADFGYVTPVWEIAGARVVATAGVVALAIGYVAAGRLEDLFPDEEGIYIVAFEASDDTGGAIYELSEDQFAAMDVVHGTLFEWPVAKRVYEVKEYRPDENVAVGNWRESIAGSQFAGDALVNDAMDQIAEIRDEFEPEARKSRHLQRRIRSIVRKLDRRRLLDQQEIIDPTTTPAFDRDDATVSDVVAEEIPDELLPESMTSAEAIGEEANGHAEETVGFELLDDMDEPLARND
ncbi:hypothetical protein [Halorubrum halophilum]|uniref:hypothetical protein n=1 Tax=Halorubrum halophilum TaxID=413816 RepID=UPI001D008C1E|nr:hypothetical protein [Halorubrum halophilum]